MIISRSTIREQHIKVRFDNAEILLWDTVGFEIIVPEIRKGTFYAIENIQIRSSLVANYTNIDASAQLTVGDDCSFCLVDESVVGGPVSALLAQGTNEFVTLSNMSPVLVPQPGLSAGETSLSVLQNFGDEDTLFAFGGLTFGFNNGGSMDLTGGDVGNFVDIFINYKIISL